MSRKKISTTIYVTPEQSERLRLLHERTKVPVAVYIREGIDLVLRQYEHLLPGQLPLERSLERTPPAELPVSSAAGVEPEALGIRPERAAAGEGLAKRTIGSAASKG
jgi:predicted DNA-binding protein